MTDKQMTDYLEKIDQVIENGKYKADWESLCEYPVAQWYKDAKFGIFIHWGIYAVPAFVSEWYCRMMYYKGNPTYWHHIIKYGKNFNYRDFIPMKKLSSIFLKQRPIKAYSISRSFLKAVLINLLQEQKRLP